MTELPPLPLIEPEAATGVTRTLFDTAQRLFGITPNIAKVLANSPAAMRGHLALADSLCTESTLDSDTRTRLGLLLAQEHGCDYVLSAHSFLAARVGGLSERAMADARSGSATDPKQAQILAWATALVRRRGAVTDEEVAAARAALSDAEFVDVVAEIALAVFDSYLSLAGRVPIDWPLVRHTERSEDTDAERSEDTGTERREDAETEREDAEFER
ncbi:carboxymuconolactone decarboxylase family protein [Nocardia concava]|uniref:carboxymuconolactone decarboxylase family protein n=1 Tax=Nocardia concava TaxID=257281 RepID=UPI0012FCF94C|nr:carboxymuconolactone decarboxylase family protein [Nocardia concava]